MNKLVHKTYDFSAIPFSLLRSCKSAEFCLNRIYVHEILLVNVAIDS